MQDRGAVIKLSARKHFTPNLQYQNLNSHFLSRLFLIAAVLRSCYIRRIHLE